MNEERLGELRRLAQKLGQEGHTPNHRKFLRGLLGDSVSELLAHIETQDQRITELEADAMGMAEANNECGSLGMPPPTSIGPPIRLAKARKGTPPVLSPEDLCGYD